MPVLPGSTKRRNLRVVKPGEKRKTGNAAVPPPPAHLDDDEKKAWKALGKLVTARGLYSAADYWAFEALVLAQVRTDRAAAQLRADAKAGDAAETYTTTNQAGGTMQREKAASKAYRENAKALAGWLGRFGMTPADRGRVEAGAVDDGKESPEDEFA